MPVHSLFVLNLQAKLLYQRYGTSPPAFPKSFPKSHPMDLHAHNPITQTPRYYDPGCLADPEKRRQWERVLYRHVRPLFRDALGGPQTFEADGGVAVAFCIVNDLVLQLAGTDECDALLCELWGISFWPGLELDSHFTHHRHAQ